MQELHNLRLVGWFYSGKAASLSDGILLIIWSEVIKLAAGEGLVSDILILSEDTNTAADGHSCAFVVTWEGGNQDFITSVKSLPDLFRNGVQIFD